MHCIQINSAEINNPVGVWEWIDGIANIYFPSGGILLQAPVKSSADYRTFAALSLLAPDLRPKLKASWQATAILLLGTGTRREFL